MSKNKPSTYSTYTPDEIKDKMANFLASEANLRTDARITPEQLSKFMQMYFKSKIIFGLGRDRIFQYLVKQYPDIGLSRRQVNRILQTFEITQTIQMQKNEPQISESNFRGNQCH